MSGRLSAWIALSIAALLIGAGDLWSDKRLGKDSLPKYRKQWAVVIGVNYTHLAGAEAAEVPTLKTAEQDARAVEERLIKNYGYRKENIRLLLGKEATADDVRRCFGEGFLGDQEQVTADDSVLFYFAGHGNRREKSSDQKKYVGLLYPGDVRVIPTRGVDTSSCLRMDSVIGSLTDLCPARHKLVILDSCHSGEVFNFRSHRSAGVNRGFRSDLFKKNSFQAIAASRASQVAADAHPNGSHSPFTASLLAALDGGPSDSTRRHFTASELFAFIPHRMATQPGVRQDPQGGWLEGEGDFYFFWKGVGPPPGPGDVSSRSAGMGGDEDDEDDEDEDEDEETLTPAPSTTPTTTWLAGGGVLLACLIAAAVFLSRPGRRIGTVSSAGQKPVALTPEERRLQQIVFQTLTPLQFATLLQAAEWRDAAPGALLVKQHTILDRLLLVYSGSARVLKNDRWVADILDGQFIGEMSYMTGRATSADVVASTPMRYVYWLKDRLRELLEQDLELKTAFQAQVSSDMAHKLATSKRPNSISPATPRVETSTSPRVETPVPPTPEQRLRRKSGPPPTFRPAWCVETPVDLTPEERRLQQIVFQTLTPAQVQTLVQSAEWRDAAEGVVVVKGNTILDGLLLVYSGSARVGSDDQSVTEVLEGRFIGEVSFMTGQPTPADVVAATPLRYLHWRKDRLHELFARERDLMSAVHARLSIEMAHKLAAVTRPNRPSSEND